MSMLAEIKEALSAVSPVTIKETDYKTKGYHLDVAAGPDQVVQCAEVLTGHGFFLEAITGVDWLGQVARMKEAKAKAAAAAAKKLAEAKAAAAEAGQEVPAAPEPVAVETVPEEELGEDPMEVVYDYNTTGGELCRVVVRCKVPRSKPELPTISAICSGANWHERETHDFFGIVFTGHPDLSPLLLPEDADFHPLRKDFTA
ncbi:MAG: NADH-quinone oxidoreductase subunit C [Proteobacteria bacterium]|nr:NADH-quinone oxidoreductase subunit C [Pseudomonadota bacterium]MBU1737613.1 NADH-quinone oxidoreductase subunit C [Pseudomonadota bacterium]